MGSLSLVSASNCSSLHRKYAGKKLINFLQGDFSSEQVKLGDDLIARSLLQLSILVRQTCSVVVFF